MNEHGENGRAPVEAVLELYAALRDRRISDLLNLVDRDIVCRPLVRPGLSVYHGYEGMIRLAEDMHAAHGNYDFEADKIIEEAGPRITVDARIVPEPGLGQEPLPVTSVYVLRDGKIVSIESHPEIG